MSAVVTSFHISLGEFQTDAPCFFLFSPPRDDRFACNAVEQCAATNWRESSGNVDEFDSIHHLIILPHYKESLDTLRETLSVLASHPAARASYVICLASEMAEAGVTEKVLGLMEEFGACFLEIVFSLHPRNLPGEAAGKSSNVAWAARDMHSRHKAGDIITVYVPSLTPMNTKRGLTRIWCSMDADSCFAADFFAAAASKYTRADVETRRSLMFVAPIFFDRNADGEYIPPSSWRPELTRAIDVAAPVVCTDILWCAAGLGTMYDGSLAKLPTSAYAMSAMLAARIGFWDAGPEAIGEDLHVSRRGGEWDEEVGTDAWTLRRCRSRPSSRRPAPSSSSPSSRPPVSATSSDSGSRETRDRGSSSGSRDTSGGVTCLLDTRRRSDTCGVPCTSLVLSVSSSPSANVADDAGTLDTPSDDSLSDTTELTRTCRDCRR